MAEVGSFLLDATMSIEGKLFSKLCFTVGPLSLPGNVSGLEKSSLYTSPVTCEGQANPRVLSKTTFRNYHFMTVVSCLPISLGTGFLKDEVEFLLLILSSHDMSSCSDLR